MKVGIVTMREPLALALPGFKGGPAPYAGRVITLIWLGRHSRIVTPRPANDNIAGAVA